MTLLPLSDSPSQPIGFIPLDGRPICYDFPLLLAEMAGIAVQCPPKALLGNLKQPADWLGLRHWLTEAIPGCQGVIASLDMLAYGGLIPSRVGDEPLAVLQDRALEALALLQQGKPVQGFSAILRIPHYNNAEEEPDYWAEYGLSLALFSAAVHHDPITAHPPHIPALVMADFLARRRRNERLNHGWLAQLSAHQLASLTFCQDDTGAFGLNVKEAETLAFAIEQQSLTGKAWVQTGADELAQTLLGRQMMAALSRPPKVWVCPTSAAAYTQLIARFDGVPLAQVVAQRLAACGAEPAATIEQADLVWIVHSPGPALQGDHCEGIVADSTEVGVAVVLATITQAQTLAKPVIIGDVAYANGGDPLLLEALLTQTCNPCQWLYGYAGWNTPGNALGSALAMGLLRYGAEQQGQGRFKAQPFAHALALRLLEDGAYQAHVRGHLRQQLAHQPNHPLPSLEELTHAMAPWAQRIGDWLGWQPAQGWRYEFPCGRTFEIEITSQF